MAVWPSSLRCAKCEEHGTVHVRHEARQKPNRWRFWRPLGRPERMRYECTGYLEYGSCGRRFRGCGAVYYDDPADLAEAVRRAFESVEA